MNGLPKHPTPPIEKLVDEFVERCRCGHAEFVEHLDAGALAAAVEKIGSALALYRPVHALSVVAEVMAGLIEAGAERYRKDLEAGAEAHQDMLEWGRVA